MEILSTRRSLRVKSVTFFLLIVVLGMIVVSQSGRSFAPNPQKAPTSTAILPSTGTLTGTIFDHVVIIVMENEGIYDICRQNPPPCSITGPAPYVAGLANNYTIGSHYLSLINTSQPNYVALLSGSMQGCTSGGCPVITAPNLVDRFEATGLTWRGYFENQTLARGCDLRDHDPYTVIHNPFIAFQDITNNTARCNKIFLANPNTCASVTDCILVNDLNNATAPAPNFMWLTPNDCHNMRGSSVCGTSSLIGPGNAYLSRLVPLILNSRTFTTTRSALFITFDEGNIYCPLNGSTTEDCVYDTWIGPVAKNNFVTPNLYNHYSFTKTIETNWNLASFTTTDATANPMTEFFKNQPPDFTIKSNPSILASPPGSRTNSTVTLASINNFTGTVALSATSSPSGPSLTLNPTSVTLTARGTGTSTLTFTAANTGNYTVTVNGTNGTLSHNATISVSVAPPDFTISASPSSLTFGQLTSTAGSSIAVNSTGDRTFFESSYLQTSFYAKGLIWLFYEDSRFTCEHQTGCMFYTTSTNGTHWAPASKVAVHITDSDFSVYTNGTSVFYVRYNETSYDSTCAKKMLFGLGTLSPSGTITWQPEQTVLTGAADRTYPDDEITVDSNGQVWIAYLIDNNSACGGTGTERPIIIHSAGTNYASWPTSGNVTLCVSACHSLNWHIALVSIGGGEIYSLYWISKYGVHGRLYNGTGWSNEETISSDVTDVNNWLFNSGPSIYAIYFDNITETYNFASRSPTGTWTVSLIGAAETHSGTLAFSSSYYALPDAASFDAKDNLFDLFYMNATNQRIDQWSGSGSSWTKTTGLVSTSAVPYSDSISSFIQSSTTVIGSIFYISGSTSFTINSASISFTPAGNTGTFTVTLASKYGFSSTVSLSASIFPSPGLSGGCSPTSIPGGSGSSTCSLTASTKGNFTVTVTATNGTITHSAIVTVTVLAFPDFSLTVSQPSPVDAGQSSVPTITITAFNGFSGVVTLTDAVPTGLVCGTITPGSVTGSGSATMSCVATIAANYTLTITGTSGSLAHNATVTLRFQDFTLSATSPTTVAGVAATTTVTIKAVNGFTGTVSLTDTVPTGLGCGTITPNSVAGSGTATLSCMGNSAGNYTLSITGVSSPLSHAASLIFQVTDFTVTSSPTTLVSPVGTNATSTITITSINGFFGSISLNDAVQNAVISGGGAGGGRVPLEMSPPSSNPTTTLSPVTVNVPRGGSGQSTLTIIISFNVQAGNYPITITATQGSLSHSTQLTMTATDFSLGSSASSVTIRAGSNSTMTLSLQSINGFQGNLTLSATVSPSGPVATLNPSMLRLTTSNSSLLTIIIPSNTPAGNYTLTVQATSGTLSHTIYITITVPSGFTTVLAGIFSSDQMAKIGLIFAASMFALVSIRAITNNKKWRVKVAIRTANRRIRTNERGHVMNASCPISVGTAWISTGIPGD